MDKQESNKKIGQYDYKIVYTPDVTDLTFQADSLKAVYALYIGWNPYGPETLPNEHEEWQNKMFFAYMAYNSFPAQIQETLIKNVDFKDLAMIDVSVDFKDRVIIGVSNEGVLASATTALYKLLSEGEYKGYSAVIQSLNAGGKKIDFYSFMEPGNNRVCYLTSSKIILE